MSERIKIEVYEGNAVRHTFNLKNFRVNGPADVSSAAEIRIEWDDPNAINQAPIVLSAVEPGADWANGMVVWFVQAPVTTGVGDKPFGLTIVINGETITYETGDVIVKDRPGVTT